MTFKELVLQKLQEIPPEKQKEVLNFIDSLKEESGSPALHSLEGLWADLGVQLSEKDIAQARTEMWSNFARNFS